MFRKLLLAGVLVVILIPVLWVAFPYYTAKTVTITVTDKERVPDGEDGSYYLIFTDGEVFQNIDVWRRLKTNSSDVQGQLQVGKTFVVTVYGWRIPALSKYRNIASIQSEVTPSMIASASLEDLDPRVARVRETKLPVAVLIAEVFHPGPLREVLGEQFPDETVLVFGEEAADLWGIMIYWDPSEGVILEATPMTREGETMSREWGPGRQ